MAAAESLTITRGIDDRVRAVDHNVIEGELYRVSLSPNLSSVFPVRCKGNRSSDSTSRQSS
jgi:hypothetical protein